MTTEQEYIDISDKQKIYDIYSILASVSPGKSSVIEAKEYGNLLLILSKWRERFNERLIIEGDKEGVWKDQRGWR